MKHITYNTISIMQ